MLSRLYEDTGRDEELAELKQELSENGARDRLEDELGDLLFVAANLARHLKIDPEAALRRANAKFERRFHAIEAAIGDGLQDALDPRAVT